MVLCRKNRPCGLKFSCGGGSSSGGPAVAVAAAAAAQLPASCSQQAHLASSTSTRRTNNNGMISGNGLPAHDFSASAFRSSQLHHHHHHQAFDQCDGFAVAMETPQLPNIGPTEVLPHLYIGSQADSLDADVMQRCGITHVINVSNTCPQSEHVADANFLRIPVNDGYTDKLLPHFQRAFNFLERVRESSGRCLVHCLAGISRSPTLSIAYIMKHLVMSQDEAYKFVKQQRQHISPNFNFLGQLSEFERQLRSAHEQAAVAAAAVAAAAVAVTAPTGDRPEAKRQRTSASSPSGALSQLTFSAGVAATRRPRSVLLAGGPGSGPVPSIRRSHSTEAFLAVTVEAIEDVAAEGPAGPVACLS